MTLEEFKKIMNDDDIKTIIFKIEYDSTLVGLNLMAKYLPKNCIQGADHDVLYGAVAEDLIKAGLTRDDAIKLKELNWMIEDDCLQSFV